MNQIKTYQNTRRKIYYPFSLKTSFAVKSEVNKINKEMKSNQQIVKNLLF